MTADSESVTPELALHLERHLGRIQRGWTRATLGTPFQVAEFGEGGATATSFATLGLSRCDLISPSTGKHAHLEFLISVHPDYASPILLETLVRVGVHASTTRQAVDRGQVLNTGGSLPSVGALYATAPSYWDAELARCRSEDREVDVLWLVPIQEPEAAFVSDHGWEAFEDLLASTGPDLLSPVRSPVVQT